jgi:hypothetical protein
VLPAAAAAQARGARGAESSRRRSALEGVLGGERQRQTPAALEATALGNARGALCQAAAAAVVVAARVLRVAAAACCRAAGAQDHFRALLCGLEAVVLVR